MPTTRNTINAQSSTTLTSWNDRTPAYTDAYIGGTSSSGYPIGTDKANNKFIVAMQTTSGTMMYSTDGITWTAGTIGTNWFGSGSTGLIANSICHYDPI